MPAICQRPAAPNNSNAIDRSFAAVFKTLCDMGILQLRNRVDHPSTEPAQTGNTTEEWRPAPGVEPFSDTPRVAGPNSERGLNG